MLSQGIPSFFKIASCFSDGRSRKVFILFIGTPKVDESANVFSCSGVKVTPYSSPIFSSTAFRSDCLSILMNILPSGSTNIERIFFSGILISETEAGVVTCTGSFFTNVDVSIKKVSNSTVTSLIAVMSMNVLFFLIFALPMILEFYRVSTFIYELQQMSAQ